jgi:hypothetical protein
LAAVGIHYEVLNHASARLKSRRKSHRFHVAFAVLIAIVGHVLEVLVFAVGWSLLLSQGVAMLSLPKATFGDVVYFSFSTYTSLGYGDIVPLGPARLLAGVESLVGLVLIAWTASFTFFEMQKFWNEDKI